MNEIQQLSINNGDILVSYDVSSLFTNVHLDETIQLLTDMAFTNNWFNETTNFFSVDKTLSIFSEEPIKVNFSFSMVSCMNKQTSGGSRPSDKGGGGGGHPDPEIREGGRV